MQVAVVIERLDLAHVGERRVQHREEVIDLRREHLVADLVRPRRAQERHEAHGHLRRVFGERVFAGALIVR